MPSVSKVVVACSALVLVMRTPALARQLRVDQRLAASSVNTFPGGSILVSIDVMAELKGAPGPGRNRSIVLAGQPVPLSERCAGFTFELPVLGGSGVTTHADLSQLNFVMTSGFLCTSGVGPFLAGWEATVVGGSGRFSGASGTLSGVFQGIDVGPPIMPELMTSFTGTVTGTIIVP